MIIEKELNAIADFFEKQAHNDKIKAIISACVAAILIIALLWMHLYK